MQNQQTQGVNAQSVNPNTETVQRQAQAVSAAAENRASTATPDVKAHVVAHDEQSAEQRYQINAQADAQEACCAFWQGKNVLMMAGGTGGHVYPALTVARRLTSCGATVHWLGNQQGFEGEKVPASGYVLHHVAVRGLRGRGVLGWLSAPFMLLRALWQAGRVINQVKPAVVIGMGGFASGPGGIMARLKGVPLLIHEQNAVMGMTNKHLAKIADCVLLGYAQAASALKAPEKARVVGNPVRDEISALPPPSVRYATHKNAIKLLVLGGSQGAKQLNTLVAKALALLPVEQRPKVLHQVGQKWLEEARALYQQLGVEAEVVPFIEDIANAYEHADWVIARAGALTVAELATVGIPTLFVPFPHAVDDHQTSNAQVLVEMGLADISQESELSAEILANYMSKQQSRLDLHHRAMLLRRLSSANAVDEIVASAKELVKP